MPGKEIGGIEQFAQIGGKRKPPSEAPTPVQSPPPRPVGESAVIVQPAPALPPSPVAARPDRPAKRERERMTVYLPIDQAEWVRVQAARGRKEISEIVEKAIEDYRARTD